MYSYNFDASSIVHAWDEYPPSNKIFDFLWEWVREKISDETFSISEVALQETINKAPECATWLKNNGIKVYKKEAQDIILAYNITQLLDIVEGKYHPSGVGLNDTLIISISNRLGKKLVSNEARQASLPNKKSRYKIPAVCKELDILNVECINFLDLLLDDDLCLGHQFNKDQSFNPRKS